MTIPKFFALLLAVTYQAPPPLPPPPPAVAPDEQKIFSEACLPKPLNQSAGYPAELRGSGASGGLVLLLALNACGEARRVTVEMSSGNEALDSAAVQAAQKWVVSTPELLRGRGLAVKVPVIFLEDSSDQEADKRKELELKEQLDERRRVRAALGRKAHSDAMLSEYRSALDSSVLGSLKGMPLPKVNCRVEATQIPGGEITHLDFLECSYDEKTRGLVESAIRARTLPYSGFEAVFQRRVTLDLCGASDACPQVPKSTESRP